MAGIPSEPSGVAAKSETIGLRLSNQLKEMIDKAARITRKTRTEFMLEAAASAAEDALLNQQIFLLEDVEFKQFVEQLDASLPKNSQLDVLIRRSPSWTEFRKI